MKLQSFYCLIICSLFYCSPTFAQLGIVSINYKESDFEGDDISGSYGVAAAENWHNIKRFAAEDFQNVTSNSGAATTIDVTVPARRVAATTGGTTLANTAMRGGFITYVGNDPTTVIGLAGVTDTYSEYDVVLYLGGFNGATGGNSGSISDGTSTFVYTVPNPFTTNFIQSTDTDATDGADNATYVRFNGLTTADATFTLTALNGGVMIGGVQVIGKAGPVSGGLACDFDSNGTCDVTDIDALYAAIGSADTKFDLNDDQVTNADDIPDWLTAASSSNNSANPNGHTLAIGDTNFDGSVDSTDLGNLLNNFGEEKTSWGAGNLNGDGGVNSEDLGALLNKFGTAPPSAANAASAVPEPQGLSLLLLVGMFVGFRYRRVN